MCPTFHLHQLEHADLVQMNTEALNRCYILDICQITGQHLVNYSIMQLFQQTIRLIEFVHFVQIDPFILMVIAKMFYNRFGEVVLIVF